MHTLSLRIRKARTSAALSQAELARRIGVIRSAVTQWEHAGGTTPSVEHLIQIAQETHTCFEWLATGRGSSSLEKVRREEEVVIIDDYAMDASESQALGYLRCLPSNKKRIALQILQVLAN